MALLDRILSQKQPEEREFSLDTWINDFLMPSVLSLGSGRTVMPNQTMAQTRMQAIASTLPGYMSALRSSPPAFAAQMVRATVLSQARFTYRNPPWAQNPRKTFGTKALQLLERPWPNGTTGDLISLMEWHAGLAGNAFCLRQPQRLRVMRPDYMAVVFGSEREPDDPELAIDAEVLGYIYQQGGVGRGRGKLELFDVDDVAHWSPIPDPENPGLGMSWITPAVRDIQTDKAATEFKGKFLTNGATPNLVVKGLPGTKKLFLEAVEMLEERHTGVANAFKTLYLAAGADATVVGSNLKDLDLRTTQGGSETRISMLSRVPAPVLGIAAGLEGSSLNAGNFGQARRLFADTWVYPTMQDLAHALSPVVDVPPNAELWFDATDIPLLHEDAKDLAEINALKATTVRTLVDGGYTPESAVAAVDSGDFRVLQHTGLYSVQLQKPGTTVVGSVVEPNALPAPKNGDGNG